MQRKAFLILFLAIFLSVSLMGYGTAYFVKNGGNDAASGLDDANAWETLDKVRTTGFNPADIISFKRNDTWTCDADTTLWITSNGDGGDQITYNAYGTGVKPIIDGNSANNYCVHSTKDYITLQDLNLVNAVVCNIMMEGDYNQVIDCNLDSGDLNGIRISASDNVTLTRGTCSSNGNTGIFVMGDTDTLVIDGMEIASNGAKGMDTLECNGSVGITVKNCNVHDNQHTGIAFNADSCRAIDTVLVENNTFTDNNVSAGNFPNLLFYKVSNGICRYNIGKGSKWSIIDCYEGVTVDIYYNIGYDGTNFAMEINAGTSINVYNNTMTENGSVGLFINYGDDGCWPPPAPDITAKNNIFSYNTDADVDVDAATNGVTTIALDNNCYWNDAGVDIMSYHGDTYHRDQFAAYQAAKSQDADGIAIDSKFIDAANDNFRLNPHSPCINAGADVSLTDDYLGRKVRHAPDMGAYENQTNVLFMGAFSNPLLLTILATLAVIAYKRRC